MEMCSNKGIAMDERRIPVKVRSSVKPICEKCKVKEKEAFALSAKIQNTNSVRVNF